MKYLIYIILICVILFFVRKFLNRFKFPKITAVSLFTGGVKSGKSAISLACALNVYNRTLRQWKVRTFFQKLFKKPLDEKPLLYSSIPLSVPYVPLDKDLLLRKKRFNYKSVVFIDEASLVADSMLIKDLKVNTELLLFFKLFGHETRGGKVIVNTHCITDLHFALKRCTSQYFYVNSISRYIPFLCLANIREERYAEDGTAVNTYTEDVEDSLKKVLFSKSVFKKYDCFCFSCLTDNLDNKGEDNIEYKDKKDLKTREIVSFRKEFDELNNNNDVVGK